MTDAPTPPRDSAWQPDDAAMPQETPGTAPGVRASFVNAIASEGTREEAVNYLLETWNELCETRQRLATMERERDEAEKAMDIFRISMGEFEDSRDRAEESARLLYEAAKASLDAEKERAMKLRDGSPASTYTRARIDKIRNAMWHYEDDHESASGGGL